MRLFEIDGDTSNAGIYRIFILIQICLDIIFENKTKENFQPKINANKIISIIGKNNYSPGRLACLNYLINFLELNYSNRSLSILDIGCGSGRYYEIIKKIVHPKNVTYLGVDVKENDDWKIYRNKNASFIKKKINKTSDIDFTFNPDLIFSQSALEHVNNDAKLLEILLQK